jgi:hypothetical protein
VSEISTMWRKCSSSKRLFLISFSVNNLESIGLEIFAWLFAIIKMGIDNEY